MKFTPMKPSSRVGRYGKAIECPHCGFTKRVYHLSWSALQCCNCEKMVDKYDWAIQTK